MITYVLFRLRKSAETKQKTSTIEKKEATTNESSKHEGKNCHKPTDMMKRNVAMAGSFK